MPPKAFDEPNELAEALIPPHGGGPEFIVYPEEGERDVTRAKYNKLVVQGLYKVAPTFNIKSSCLQKAASETLSHHLAPTATTICLFNLFILLCFPLPP